MNSVFLRAFELEDYLLINEWRNDISIQKMTGGDFRYVSSEMEKEWVRERIMNNHTDIYLAICTNDVNRKMIGYVSINNINHLHRTADGGGIVIGDILYRDGFSLIEAFLLVLSHVFDNLNINRYTGACLLEHSNSRLMMEMLGFQMEGVKRQAVYKNGVYHDMIVFSILREEYYSLLKNGEYDQKKIIQRMKYIKANIKK